MPERDHVPRGESALRPDAGTRPSTAEERTPAARLADHAAIDRLAADLLPALVARLSGTGLGELEVREGGWHLRLRRPATAERPAGERPVRAARGTGREGGREGGRDSRAASLPGEGGMHGHDDAGRHVPLLATSPAVGVFRARPDVRTGARVRAGDRLGAIDLLGVPQDVLAPSEAVVAALFVEDGDAVEYGQPLLALEPVGPPEHEQVPQAVPVG
jgi:acetyl-CoA carboxylase biotin carboxyl carrier protein